MRYTEIIDKAVDAGERRAVIGRISSTAVDRQGDVLLPGGMQFDAYMSNAVLLFAHDKTRPPVGKTLEIRRKSNEVLAKVAFAPRPPTHPPAAEWIPDTLYHLYRQDYMRGFSVGFLVSDGGERRPTTKELQAWPGVRRVISQWQLLELSVVSVPANPDALTQAVEKGLLEEGSSVWCLLRQAELIHAFDDGPVDARPILDLSSGDSRPMLEI